MRVLFVYSGNAFLCDSFVINIVSFIDSCIVANIMLFCKHPLFGFLDGNTNLNSQLYRTNLLILLAKFQIHKCKFTNKKTDYLVFTKEVKQKIDFIHFSVKIQRLFKKNLN